MRRIDRHQIININFLEEAFSKRRAISYHLVLPPFYFRCKFVSTTLGNENIDHLAKIREQGCRGMKTSTTLPKLENKDVSHSTEGYSGRLSTKTETKSSRLQPCFRDFSFSGAEFTLFPPWLPSFSLVRSA